MFGYEVKAILIVHSLIIISTLFIKGTESQKPKVETKPLRQKVVLSKRNHIHLPHIDEKKSEDLQLEAVTQPGSGILKDVNTLYKRPKNSKKSKSSKKLKTPENSNASKSLNISNNVIHSEDDDENNVLGGELDVTTKAATTQVVSADFRPLLLVDKPKFTYEESTESENNNDSRPNTPREPEHPEISDDKTQTQGRSPSLSNITESILIPPSAPSPLSQAKFPDLREVNTRSETNFRPLLVGDNSDLSDKVNPKANAINQKLNIPQVPETVQILEPLSQSIF